MIVVDTSALMAVLLDEAEAGACAAALETADRLVISAGTLAETLVVAGRKAVGAHAEQLIVELGFEVAGVTQAVAQDMARAYGRWGKGVHPAGLNLGDCFAYVLARERGCRLLYVGQDFARTDVGSVL